MNSFLLLKAYVSTRMKISTCKTGSHDRNRDRAHFLKNCRDRDCMLNSLPSFKLIILWNPSFDYICRIRYFFLFKAANISSVITNKKIATRREACFTEIESWGQERLLSQFDKISLLFVIKKRKTNYFRQVRMSN